MRLGTALLLLLAGCRFTAGVVADGGALAEDAPAGTDSAAPGTDAAGPPLADAGPPSADAGPPSADAAPPPVDAAPSPPVDCLAARQAGVTTDGVLTIDPDGPGGAAPFAAYCEMTTAGGGWTLVWSYGFTDPANFSRGFNAVTPRPTWGVPMAGGTPTSTTVPTSPTSRGALEFARWKDLGEQFLVKSDLDNWITCAPAGGPFAGSLVNLVDGALSCAVVRPLLTYCKTVAPVRIERDLVAVGLYASNNYLSTYYYWEGSQATANWPTHDPCGMNFTPAVLPDAGSYGAVFLRR